ncbi:WSSV082 [White spot syndrome virus]|nr:WSSV082 [Shrimp white spot syndrome virus]
MTNLIPVVTATNVIQSLAKENPGLLFTIHNAALAHSHREGYGGSHLLGLAKKLSRGFINFRQFQNQLFSPKKESKIMYDIFLSVKAIMARDDRYDGLCDMRMNSMMDASFLKVRKKPECVFITKLLDKNFRRHIINDEEEETRERFGGEEEEEDDDEEFEDEEEEQAEREWGEEEGESAYDISVINDKNNTIGHDVDIILCNRKKLTLTKENSVFVNEHIDSFMVGNLIGAEGSLIQICFDNCTGEFEGLPKFCLYDSSSKDKDTIP